MRRFKVKGVDATASEPFGGFWVFVPIDFGNHVVQVSRNRTHSRDIWMGNGNIVKSCNMRIPIML